MLPCVLVFLFPGQILKIAANMMNIFFQFAQQYRHYQSTLQIFQLKPTTRNETLIQLVMFLGQVGCVTCNLLEIFYYFVPKMQSLDSIQFSLHEMTLAWVPSHELSLYYPRVT